MNIINPLTTHDSSLSPAVHMLVANRLGMEEETEQFLDRTIAVDMELVRRGAEDGIHIANCGALWQMAVQGFMGCCRLIRERNFDLNHICHRYKEYGDDAYMERKKI